MEFSENEKILEYVEPMKQSAHRMVQLTRQLLAYARGGKYNPQTMSLSDYIVGALSLIQHDLGPNIRVETDLALDIMSVEADSTQMQMVLSAIVTNAKEAIEGPGRMRITTRNVEVDADFIEDHPGLKAGPYACLSIDDDGKGMDKETRNRIFDPFYTTHFIGRGLGMASVYGIVKNHDGWVSVDSELGKGTVVCIYLPAIEAKEEVEEKVVSVPKLGPVKGEGTILVIEDEEDVMLITRRALERLGYRVIETRTGEEAVEIAKAFDGRIDLALLDIKLPDISGDKVYPLIMESRPDLKVIVFTGYTIDGPAQDILDAGAEAFIQKPFSISTLADKLKEVLEGK
ncbi:MAG: response regulator [Desulfobacteraceae bacterium]|nr:response regulator [Desulfobacteraceae bacterium]